MAWRGCKKSKIVKNSENRRKIRIFGVLRALNSFENFTIELLDLENTKTTPPQPMWRILWLGIIGNMRFYWCSVHRIALKTLPIDFYTMKPLEYVLICYISSPEHGEKWGIRECIPIILFSGHWIGPKTLPLNSLTLETPKRHLVSFMGPQDRSSI